MSFDLILYNKVMMVKSLFPPIRSTNQFRSLTAKVIIPKEYSWVVEGLFYFFRLQSKGQDQQNQASLIQESMYRGWFFKFNEKIHTSSFDASTKYVMDTVTQIIAVLFDKKKT